MAVRNTLNPSIELINEFMKWQRNFPFNFSPATIMKVLFRNKTKGHYASAHPDPLPDTLLRKTRHCQEDHAARYEFSRNNEPPYHFDPVAVFCTAKANSISPKIAKDISIVIMTIFGSSAFLSEAVSLLIAILLHICRQMYYTSHPAFLRAHSEKRSPSLSLAEKDENAEGHKIVETLKILVAGKDSEAILRLINRVQRDNDRWWEVVGNKGSVEMVKALAFASSDSDILIRTLHRVESKYRSTEMYNTVIASLVKSGKSILAFKEFYSMQHIGVKPNGDTYGLLVDAYYLKNNWFKILGLFEDMKRESVSPSANAYNSAMRALTKHGHWGMK
eukprot:jgi/Bigna1/76415/fgenesh1_pg.41_\